MSSFIFRAVTRENHTFLEFNTPVKIVDSVNGARLVLEELVDFKRQNPDLHVTGWKPETHMAKMPVSGSFAMHNKAFPRCFGIWIDHEPKQKPEPASELDNALGQD